MCYVYAPVVAMPVLSTPIHCVSPGFTTWRHREWACQPAESAKSDDSREENSRSWESTTRACIMACHIFFHQRKTRNHIKSLSFPH